jgi:hypothetical protein
MSDSYSPRGISFLGLLTLLFIAFKILGYISWSWWWVLCPLWIPVAIFLFIMALAGTVALVSVFLEK